VEKGEKERSRESSACGNAIKGATTETEKI